MDSTARAVLGQSPPDSQMWMTWVHAVGPTSTQLGQLPPLSPVCHQGSGTVETWTDIFGDASTGGSSSTCCATTLAPILFSHVLIVLWPPLCCWLVHWVLYFSNWSFQFYYFHLILFYGLFLCWNFLFLFWVYSLICFKNVIAIEAFLSWLAASKHLPDTSHISCILLLTLIVFLFSLWSAWVLKW